MKKISFVVPCYNEEDSLPAFFETLTRVAKDLPNYEFEFLFVDDGSSDQTPALLETFADDDDRAVVFYLSRNFGKEAALTAGLDFATGDAVVPIDADLQDPPDLVGQMIELWENGAPVVVARRSERASDTFLKRTTAKAFYRLQNAIGDTKIAENAGDFRLMDRIVVDAIKQLPERNRFMKGLLSWPGFQQAEISYERPMRHGGQTKFNYWRLWNFALDGVTSFSTVPLRIWTYLGLGVAFFALMFGLWLIVRTLIFGIDLPGYASLMVVVLFLGALQLVGLGMIGEYLGRTYCEVKRRPLYLVSRSYRSQRMQKTAVTPAQKVVE